MNMSEYARVGNSSQSVITIPNIFLTRDINCHEAFIPKNKKQYYVESKLIRQMKNINLSNNPQIKSNAMDELNRTRYIPPLKPEFIKTTQSIFENNGGYQFKSKSYQAFTDHMNKTDANEYIYPKLREEIQDNLTSILERINSNYDIPKWSKVSGKDLKEQTDDSARYFNLTTSRENQTVQFRNTLRSKLDSLKINEPNKTTLVNRFDKFSQNITKPNTVNPEAKYHIDTNFQKTHITSAEETERKVPFIENKNTFMFNKDPSATRSEFTIKRGTLISTKRKKNNYDVVNAKIFNCSAYSEVFSAEYPKAQHQFKHYKTTKRYNI